MGCRFDRSGSSGFVVSFYRLRWFNRGFVLKVHSCRDRCRYRCSYLCRYIHEVIAFRPSRSGCVSFAPYKGIVGFIGYSLLENYFFAARIFFNPFSKIVTFSGGVPLSKAFHQLFTGLTNNWNPSSVTLDFLITIFSLIEPSSLKGSIPISKSFFLENSLMK